MKFVFIRINSNVMMKWFHLWNPQTPFVLLNRWVCIDGSKVMSTEKQCIGIVNHIFHFDFTICTIEKRFQKSFKIGLILTTNCIHVYPWMILTSRRNNSKKWIHTKKWMYKHWIENKIDDRMNKWITNWNKVLWWMLAASEEFCCNYVCVHICKAHV